jgi:hypothetical protein
MYMGHKVLILVLGLALPAVVLPASFVLFAQDGGSFTLPAEIHRPQYGEAPRFPRDYWIGELGRGEAGEEVYRFARRFLEDLAGGNTEQTPEHIKASLEPLEGLEIRNVRIGGGRIEPDGSVSFMVRFLGREEAVIGEIFLRQREQPKTVEASETPETSETLEASETPETSEILEVSETLEASEAPEIFETPAIPEISASETSEIPTWYVDDLILDQRRPLGESRYGPESGDLTPYERFF